MKVQSNLLRILVTVLLVMALFAVFGFLRTKQVGVSFTVLLLQAIVAGALFFFWFLTAFGKKSISIVLITTAIATSATIGLTEGFAFGQEEKIRNENPNGCEYRSTYNVKRWWPFGMNEIACGKDGSWVGND